MIELLLFFIFGGCIWVALIFYAIKNHSRPTFNDEELHVINRATNYLYHRIRKVSDEQLTTSDMETLDTLDSIHSKLNPYNYNRTKR